MPFSRFQLNALARCAQAAIAGPLTNAQAKRIGVNLSSANSYEYGHTYLNYSRRFAQQWLDVSTGLPVALKANKCPAVSYRQTLQANTLAGDAGVYACGMNGAFASISATVGTFTNVVYDSVHDKTTMTYTLTGPGVGDIITVTTPSSSSDYLRIVPVGYDPFVNDADFHPHLLTRIAAYGTSTVRGMDWLNTNANTNTDWAGSDGAGADGTIRSAGRSLAELVRFCNRAGVDLHFNAPPLATDDWLANSLNWISANLSPSLYVYPEYSNEPWNGGPGGNELTHLPQVMALGGSFSFGATGTCGITSVVRSGGVVTVTLASAPANTTGPFVVSGVTNITGGLIDVATKGLVVSGNTFTYNETGADVTGTAPGQPYNCYVHTNPTHYLVKALATVGDPSSLGVTLYQMVQRYIIERTRSWWTLSQGLADKARYRFVLNQSFGGGNDYVSMPYAIERFGDSSWLYQSMMAPYFSAASLSDVESTIGQLTTSVNAFAKTLVQQANVALSYGKKVGYYEGGPSLANATTSAQGVVASAVLKDVRVGSLITKLYGFMRDLGQTSAFNYYKDGASYNWSVYNGQPGYTGGQAYNLLDLDPTDLTGPKPQALIQFAQQSSTPQSYPGLTWGTIPILDVTAIGTSSAGVRVFYTTTVVPDLYVQIVPPAAGAYTLALNISGNSASDWLTALLNGVELTHQTPLSVASGFTVAATPTFIGSVTLHAGVNILVLRLKPATRAGFNNLGTIVIG